MFLSGLAVAGQREVPLPEPIVAGLFLDLLPVIAIVLQIPALTMRLLAEEKRTGSMEVLLTAPVNEWPIVLSKFLATWIFFLITWLPAGLFLIALRLEVVSPFDYRPLLSFYVASRPRGWRLLAWASVLLDADEEPDRRRGAHVRGDAALLPLLPDSARTRSHWDCRHSSRPPWAGCRSSTMWIESLAGRFRCATCLLFASLGLFWLFLSVKVLETRKWN